MDNLLRSRIFHTVLFSIFYLLQYDSNGQTTITVSIDSDCWATETSWYINDSGGNEMASVSTGTMQNQTNYTTDVVLNDDCFEFHIGDSYGDGMTSSCGVEGNYTISDEFGNVLVQMPTAAFGFGATHFFSLPFGSDNGCTDSIAENYSPCAINDDGSCTYAPLAAGFSFEADAFCEGATVQFIDESIGNPNSWSWTFTSGNPSISTDQNPQIQFPSSGIFTVNLTVTNALMESSSWSMDIDIAEGHLFEVIINQDNYPQETSWDMADELGNIVASGDVNGQSFCIEDNCHSFTIYDSYGDGICCGYGNGSFSLVLDGIEIATGGDFGNQQTVSVNCAPGSDCNNTLPAIIGLNTAPYPNAWYVFIPDTTGQWKISTCDLATCDTEIWLYDYCDMSFFDDTNEGAITWNDDLCGVQAEVTPILEKDEIYYLRIGDQASACGTDEIPFLIEFMGGVPGCMEPLACNYLPIAAEPAVCYFEGDPECPTIGPDLEMNGEAFYSSMYFTTLNNNDACYINEGCMQGFGNREIIRFSTHILNIGNEDYFIGAPSDEPDQFEWDDCHNHWHYEGYAEYLLYDDSGFEMPQIGFKNGFCVLDLECSGGGQAKYTCGNMGITAGCGDIYSSGLQCQWIDVTDVPGGDYTFVIRTNWDQSPDANGSYELSYSNNWAAVCVSFERDGNGNLINFTKNQDCPVLYDCDGVPFGASQPDCATNCPGFVVKGDLNGSGDLEIADTDQYIADILGNDAIVSNCSDLDGDGTISVTDAALIAGCVFYGPDHVDENGVHDHCIWNDEIVDPNQTVTLSIGDVNEEMGYVDVHILNPDNRIVGFEFDLSGITIMSVENLADPIEYDIIPQFTLGGQKVIGVAYDDQTLPKNLVPAPLLRIYYFSTSDVEVCISNIVDVVNDEFYNSTTVIGNCMMIMGGDFADFTSTQTTICEGESVNYTDISTESPISWAWSFSGGSPATSTDQNPIGIVYNIPGTYDVTLTATNIDGTDSETKTGYIIVETGSTYYADLDNDTYGDPLNSLFSCSQPIGYVIDNTDCDDTRDYVFPGASGTMQNLDNDCNGVVEDDEVSACSADLNGDDFIDIADLLLFLGTYGCLEACDIGDFDGDGIVSSSDLLIFLPLYGSQCP